MMSSNTDNHPLQCKDFPLIYRKCYVVHRALKQMGFLESEFTVTVSGDLLCVTLTTQGRVLHLPFSELGDIQPDAALLNWLSFLHVAGRSTQPQLDTIWRKAPFSRSVGHGRLGPFAQLMKEMFRVWIVPPTAKALGDKLWGDGPPPGTPTENTFSLMEFWATEN